MFLLKFLLNRSIVKKKIKATLKKTYTGNSPAVQWLGLYTFNAKGPGSTPGRRMKIHPQAPRLRQNTHAYIYVCVYTYTASQVAQW